MKHSIAVSGLFLMASFAAFADIPPAPTPPQPAPTYAPSGPQEYSILFEENMSALLLSSVGFQSSNTITISNHTGTCTTQQKTWSSGGQALVCNVTSSCVATDPACVATFTANAGLTSSDIVTILGVHSPGSSSPNR